MAYLTFSDYNDFSTTVNETDFTKLIGDAESTIDMATRDYYQINDLSSDPNVRRVHDFKRAVAEQVDYLNFIGSSKSYEQADDDLKSISIGRLNLTPNQTAVSSSKGGLCQETYQLLAKQGLLWRGV